MTASELTRRFQAVVNRSLDEFRAAGRRDLVDEVAAEARRPSAPRPVVMIAGEMKRGKSTLVNALVRQPGLSPAGPGIATSAYLVFSYGEHTTATVSQTTSQTASQTGIPIDPEEIAEWATTDGNPGNLRQVVAVEVTADAPLLRSVTLVDTPGHGGLESAAGAISVPIARQSDAVVFVLDAGAPVTGPELAFLRSVSARVDAVIVVVAKTDDYPGWSRIVEDDKKLLERYAPDLAGAPVLAVSARIATAALTRAPGPVADELWRESGLAELERLLGQRLAARASLLRACNVLLATRDGLRTVHGLAALGLAAARGEPEVKRAIEAERTRLAAVRRDSPRWNQRVGSGIGKVKLDHTESLGRGLAELQRKYVAIIEQSKRHDHEAIADRLVADVDRLAAALAEQAGLTLAALVADVSAEMDAEGRFDAIISQAGSRDGVQRVSKASERQLTRVDKLAGFVSFSSGKSIGGIVTAIPLIAGFGLPVIGVGLGVGALFSFLMTTSRRELNMQANMKSWCQAQLAEAQRQISADFARRMIDVQENLRDALTDHVDRRRAELDRAAARYAAGPDTTSGTRAEADVARMATLIAETDQVLTLLGAFRAPRKAVTGAGKGRSL